MAPKAAATGSTTDDGIERARAGIENAKKAGIMIDPDVGPMMEPAPIGTCPNDPTLPGCPKVLAFVYSPEFFNIPEEERLLPASSDEPPTTEARVAKKIRARIRARAAHDPGFGCHVKVDEGSPYKAADRAQMNSQHYCTVTIQDLDIYTRLRKYYKGQWYNMVDRWNYPTNVNRHWYGHLTYLCTSNSVRRNSQAEIHSYVLYGNVWYGAYQQRQNPMYCG